MVDAFYFQCNRLFHSTFNFTLRASATEPTGSSGSWRRSRSWSCRSHWQASPSLSRAAEVLELRLELGLELQLQLLAEGDATIWTRLAKPGKSRNCLPTPAGRGERVLLAQPRPITPGTPNNPRQSNAFTPHSIRQARIAFGAKNSGQFLAMKSGGSLRHRNDWMETYQSGGQRKKLQPRQRKPLEASQEHGAWSSPWEEAAAGIPSN